MVHTVISVSSHVGKGEITRFFVHSPWCEPKGQAVSLVNYFLLTERLLQRGDVELRSQETDSRVV